MLFANSCGWRAWCRNGSGCGAHLGSTRPCAGRLSIGCGTARTAAPASLTLPELCRPPQGLALLPGGSKESLTSQGSRELSHPPEGPRGHSSGVPPGCRLSRRGEKKSDRRGFRFSWLLGCPFFMIVGFPVFVITGFSGILIVGFPDRRFFRISSWR